VAEKRHADHSPIDDDFDDTDIMSLVHANVTGAIHHVHGSPEHIAYGEKLAQFERGHIETQFKRPPGDKSKMVDPRYFRK
jgi:hypothetical protein